MSLIWKYLIKPYTIVGLLSILMFIYYNGISKKLSSILNFTKESISEVRYEIFTKESLAQYDGKNENDPIYLSILGSVYDVSRGRKHYGKDCTYNHFTGKDASVSFITGDFETYTENSDDVLQLQSSEILSLYNWKLFYDKEYIYKGKLIGRFYDNYGEETDYHKIVEEKIALEKEKKMEEEKLKDIFPPCNIEWNHETGTKVWCTIDSGGKTRTWAGVPRKYYKSGQTGYECACVQEDQLTLSNLKPYENCLPTSDTCYYNID